ncbi:MAG: 6-phosphofructokinase [Thermoplasmata archaeon]|nr:MAG: 6-phosphofructokinase [Thermoplasmata archaeon]RLF30969.1 MAG: 6-phosphofructokinase [Thermoplasmata archaeon]RLF35515.1 MAG: 6-phosphofructokinase [Thermoplasmata archaeon]RLF53294.1 MAG: 6-phosphofructokinase [Thermoplasmata archaeon]
MKKIGVLTGGGDCPGLNAVIRAVVKKSRQYNWDVIGIKNGWKGLINGEMELLTDYSVSGILPKGGTIIGTSRTNPFNNKEDIQRVLDNINKFGLDAIVAIGGDDTLSVAKKLYDMGVPVIGVPKTIDNDLSGTDYTFGFDTAVSIATEAIDRLHTTAESHHRVIVVELMGRHAGWIATMAGIAGGADEILIPEVPFDLDEVCKNLKSRYDRGKKFSIVAVAEGARPKITDTSNEDNVTQSHDIEMGLITQTSEKDDFGHVRLGGIGHYLAKEIEKRMNVETRVTALGHVQRGGTPTAHDRVLATRFGVAAVELIKNNDFGKMVALQGNKIVPVKLEEAVSKTKTVDMDLYEIAKVFFG